MRALVALMLVTTAAAGCLAGDGQPTAMDGLATAREAALEWHPAPVLMTTFAVEATQDGLDSEPAPEDEPVLEALMTQPDERLGDGRAPAWAYTFQEPEGTHFTVVVGAEGILHRGEAPNDELLAEAEAPITGWNIDSDASAQVIRDSSENAGRLLAYDDLFIVSQLTQNDTAEPVWLTVMFSESEDDGAFFLVNAANGTFEGEYSLEVFLEDLLRPAQTAHDEGMVSILQPTETHSFLLEDDDHPGLLVTITIEAGTGSSLSMEITSPTGVVTEHSHTPAVAAFSGLQVGIDEPVAGTWTTQVTLTSGALQEYDLFWCATGFHINAFPPDPCNPF